MSLRYQTGEEIHRGDRVTYRHAAPLLLRASPLESALCTAGVDFRS